MAALAVPEGVESILRPYLLCGDSALNMKGKLLMGHVGKDKELGVTGISLYTAACRNTLTFIGLMNVVLR